MKYIEMLGSEGKWVFLVPCPVAYVVKACVTLAVSSNVITEKTVMQTYFNIISFLLLSVLFSLFPQFSV